MSVYHFYSIYIFICVFMNFMSYFKYAPDLVLAQMYIEMKITTLALYRSARQMGNFNWGPVYVMTSFLKCTINVKTDGYENILNFTRQNSIF